MWSMTAYRAVRDLILTFYASRPEVCPYPEAGFNTLCALIPHLTPYARLSPIPDMTATIVGLMELIKADMPAVRVDFSILSLR